MLERFSILFVTICFFSAAACADSISLQHNPTLAAQRRALRVTPKVDPISHAITGDLGRGFSGSERRSLLQVRGREFFADNAVRGKLVTSAPGQVNFGFLGNTRPPGTLDTFTRQVWRLLFHHAPNGARARRKQAEAGTR